MKIYADKLQEHLRRTLKPVYIITGEEQMQLNQCCDQVREKARQLGFTERTVYSVDIDNNYQDFLQSSDNLSLFGEKKIIEIRMPKGKPGKEWGQAINTYIQRPPEDTLLLVSGKKLERGVANSAWYKKADSLGVTVSVWPLQPAQMLSWIGTQLRQNNMRATRTAVQLIAQRVEGNLLAAEQEIKKLSLLFAGSELSDAQVISAVANSSRFTVFELSDAALDANAQRTTRILNTLESEGVAEVLVLWSLSQDVQRLCEVVQLQTAGIAADDAIRKARVPPMRINRLRKALHRHTEKSCLLMMSRCAFLDRLIKGRESGDVWAELLRLALLIVGTNLALPDVVDKANKVSMCI